MTNHASPFGHNFGRCPHGRVVCSTCIVADDAAKRAYDLTRLVATNLDYETRTRGYPYLAIRLSDGTSDGVSYATRAEAIKHQFHEQLCFYFSYRDAPNGFASPKDAAIFMAMNRMAYDAGGRLTDPDDPETIHPLTREHLQNQANRLANAAGWRR